MYDKPGNSDSEVFQARLCETFGLQAVIIIEKNLTSRELKCCIHKYIANVISYRFAENSLNKQNFHA